MEFRDACAQIATGLTNEEIAAGLGLSPHTVKQQRLHADSPNFRNPPAGWQRAIAGLARERAADLNHLADILEGDTGAPTIAPVRDLRTRRGA